MNNEEIWEILETCLLTSEGVDLEEIKKQGFNPKLSEIGSQLYSYLKSKEIIAEVQNG